MHFKKLPPLFLLILSLTLNASSDLKDEDATSKAATMTCAHFVQEITFGMKTQLVERFQNNKKIKEISPSFYPDLIEIHDIVTAHIMGELSLPRRVSIIMSLPKLAVKNCYLVAARALLFLRIDFSRMFIDHILAMPLAVPIQIDILTNAPERTLSSLTKFAAGYTPYANVKSTRTHLSTLLVQWQTNRPETANEMFKQAFGYWLQLTSRGIKLDPRDVVFYLIFGEGITQHQPYLGSSFGKARYYDDIFNLNDYVKNYEALEQDGFKEANASFWSSLGQAFGFY